MNKVVKRIRLTGRLSHSKIPHMFNLFNNSEKNGSAEEYSIDDLIPTAHVDESKVEYFRNHDDTADEPITFATGPDGKRYIVDGNHRYFAALKNGKDVLTAKESDLPDEVKGNWLSRLLNG